jgi:hypothetical protein
MLSSSGVGGWNCAKRTVEEIKAGNRTKVRRAIVNRISFSFAWRRLEVYRKPPVTSAYILSLQVLPGQGKLERLELRLERKCQ